MGSCKIHCSSESTVNHAMRVKDYIIIVIVFSLLLFATPAIFENFGEARKEKSGGNQATTVELDFPKTVTLLLKCEPENEETLELTIEEYLEGCLFAQIPINYHEEALKSQAVAAHTYFQKLLSDGVEISNDPATSQPFFTEEQARERYGDEYESHLKKVKKAAEFGAKHVIVYDNAPIYAVYHSLSAGVTNTAYSVWGRDFPYLRSVESTWDRGHPDFHCVNEMTAESIRLAMFNYNKTASMPVDYSLWFADPIKNEFGYVVSVNAGENLLSGGDVWRIFGLRSTSFDISFRNAEVFVSETRGHGHGVGLSQYGADVLAKRGFLYDEILNHYYTDVTILEL